MPVRVLHIVANMNRGGLENFLMNVYRTLDKEQVQFDFLVTREVQGAFDEEIRSLGGKIYNIPQMAKVGYYQYKKTLYHFFKTHPEYHVVHCHRDALCGIYLREAKRAGISVRIAHSHTSKIGEPISIKGFLKSGVKQYFKYVTRKYCTNSFACAQLAGEWLFGKGGKQEKFQVLNNGIDIHNYTYSEEIREQVRETLGIEKQGFLIGHVGRFYYPKNHEFLIQVFQQVQEVVPQSHLCLVGNGELEKTVRQQVKALGLEEHVRFLGVREDVNQLLQAFDIFVFPSRFEGIPVTLVEAQASGVRCIVSDRITQEADIGLNLLEYLPIENSKVWAEILCRQYSALEQLRVQRRSNKEQIIQSGYDIQTTAGLLQQFYRNQYYIKKEKRDATTTNGVYTNVQ